ncbi:MULTISPECIES: hypothetical protein [unclassified Algoriphagus]|nr:MULTISPECIES: hypothetical protein [unclassified Algoriphagus]
MRVLTMFGLPTGKGRFDQFSIMSTGQLIVQETHGACPDKRSEVE